MFLLIPLKEGLTANLLQWNLSDTNSVDLNFVVTQSYSTFLPIPLKEGLTENLLQ